MNTALFYDTETTSLPLWDQPSSHPDQPHIVQIAAALVDLDKRKIIQSMDVIVAPHGWVIPPETIAVHGIDNHLAAEVGIPERMAVALFLQMAIGRLKVAHNIQFDERIMRIAIKRFKDDRTADDYRKGDKYCTANNAKPILKLPPTAKMKAGRFKNSNKMPNLGEAYKFFTGRDLVGAHNALVDVKACIAVYFGIQDRLKKAA